MVGDQLGVKIILQVASSVCSATKDNAMDDDHDGTTSIF